jgi:hypothetical protein
MSDSELAVVSVDSFATPTIITRASPSARKKFFEVFTVPIRNANTRAAYYRAIQQCLAWCRFQLNRRLSHFSGQIFSIKS